MNASRNRRSRIAALAGGVAAATGVALMLGVALPAGATSGDPHTVTLCHATGSTSNPYVVITVDVASVLGDHGHGGHTGPVFSPDLDKHVAWGDIIPAFDYGPGEQYAGMNLTSDGAATLANGCTFTVGTTSTSSTTSSTSSTSTTVLN